MQSINNDTYEQRTTRPSMTPNDAAPRVTDAACSYAAGTLRDVATSAVVVAVSVALCLKMTLRRFLTGTAGATKLAASVDLSLRNDLSSMLREELLCDVLLRAMVLRDLGDMTIVGKSVSGRNSGRGNSGGGNSGGGVVGDGGDNHGRMTTTRLRRLVFDDTSSHLDEETSHGGVGFRLLLEHPASTTSNVMEEEGGGERMSEEANMPLDGRPSSLPSTTSSVEGRSVLESLLLYYTDVVPMEGSQETMLRAGGGRVLDPRVWFHDVSQLWTDRTCSVSGGEIPLSLSHVIAFLMTREQIEILGRVSSALLSGSREREGMAVANLRVLGECWLTTSENLSDDNNNNGNGDRNGNGDHDNESCDNMNLAFQYLLRSCPAKQLEGEGGDDEDLLSTRRDRIAYLVAMMRSFALAHRPRHAVLCARSAITSIGSSPLDENEIQLLSDLWRSIFRQSIQMNDFDDAWLAIGSNPNLTARAFCVQQLISAMYDAHALNDLLRLPLLHGVRSNLLELETALERKATFSPLEFNISSGDDNEHLHVTGKKEKINMFRRLHFSDIVLNTI